MLTNEVFETDFENEWLQFWWQWISLCFEHTKSMFDKNSTYCYIIHSKNTMSVRDIKQHMPLYSDKNIKFIDYDNPDLNFAIHTKGVNYTNVLLSVLPLRLTN